MKAKKKYHGTAVELHEQEITLGAKEVPVYLGPDATLYNLNYVAIPKNRIEALSSEKKERKDATDKPIYETFKKYFPDPNKFESYFEFEQAIIDWKVEIEASIGYLQLPLPMGRNYFRPKVSIESIQVRILRCIIFQDSQREFCIL